MKERIRLSYGENLANFSPDFKKRVLKTLKKDFEKLCLYPDKTRDEFIIAVMKHHKIRRDEILTEAGIKSLLNLIFFLNKHRELVLYEPSYFMYEKLAKDHDIKIKKIKDFSELKEDKDRMILVGHPNNPTGDFLLSPKEIGKITQKFKKSIIILDQCYIYNKAILKKNNLPKNLIILRSFSKVYGLAGIRLAYAIGNRELIDSIKNLRKIDPLNVSSVSYTIGKICLEKDNQKFKNFLNLKKEFISGLRRISGIKVFDTKLTSVILDLNKKLSPQVFLKKMRSEGIEVKESFLYKDFDENLIILGVPKKEDQGYVINVIDKILKER